MPATTTQPLYLAVFVRIEIAKDQEPGERISYHLDGPDASPIYLCGLPTETLAEAEAQARESVNAHSGTARSGILPRIFQFLEGENLIAVGDRAQEWYEAKIRDLNESDEITEHKPPPKRKKLSALPRLTDEQVRELRAKRRRLTPEEAAREYGVCVETVYRIWAGRSRRDVI